MHLLGFVDFDEILDIFKNKNCQIQFKHIFTLYFVVVLYPQFLGRGWENSVHPPLYETLTLSSH